MTLEQAVQRLWSACHDIRASGNWLQLSRGGDDLLDLMDYPDERIARLAREARCEAFRWIAHGYMPKGNVR